MYEEMAVNYFRNLSPEDKKSLIKKIFDALSEEEKLEVAKIIAGKG